MSKIQKKSTPDDKKPMSNLTLFGLGFIVYMLPSTAIKLAGIDNLIMFIITLLNISSVILGPIIMLLAIGNALARKFNKE